MSPIVSARSCPAQLLRADQSLTTMPQGRQNEWEMTIGCQAFLSYLPDKVFSLCWDLPATLDTARELEAICLSLGPVMDHFK